MSDWGSTSDSDLRARGRGAEDPEQVEAWIARGLRSGQLPPAGRYSDLDPELRQQLARARVQLGLCAWCGGETYRQRSGRIACCCRACFVEVGALCFRCPREEAQEPS